MKAVILAGGEGTRLRPLTCNTPKPMVPILNRPFLEHMLSHLKGHGVDHTLLTLCYLPDVIRSHFGDGQGMDLRLSYTLEEEPLGTAGAVKNVESELDGTFFVLNGDIFTDLDLRDMVRFHRETGALVTISLTQVENPSAFGVVETDPQGRVLRFLEKPSPGETTSNWINAGIYLVEPEVLAHAPSGEFYMFERGLFPKLLDMGVPVYGYRSRSYWVDLGTPANYVKVHRDLLPAASMNADYGESSIHSSADISGPVLLGRGCTIGPEAVIRGPAVLGDGCKVGEKARITDSILWRDVSIEPGADLKGCILGNGVSIGEAVSVGEGCILADDVTVGKGNQLDRGMVLWPNSALAPEILSFH